MGCMAEYPYWRYLQYIDQTDNVYISPIAIP
jgi:hypothetical protein